MNRQHRAPSTLATAVGLVLALSGCSGSSTAGSAAPAVTSPSTSSSASPSHAPGESASASTTTSGTTSATASAAAAVISIKDFMFVVPASVAPGAMITIKNEDSQAHTVTSKQGGFDVKVFPNDSAMLTAPKSAGSFELTCDFHANMKSNLVVK